MRNTRQSTNARSRLRSTFDARSLDFARDSIESSPKVLHMKSTLLLPLAVIIFSCNQSSTTLGSGAERASIEQQVRKTSDSILDFASKLDINTFQFFDTSASFVMDGRLANYEERKNLFAKAIPQSKAQQFIKKSDELRVLDQDYALWIFHGDVINTWKNDSTETFKDYSFSCLFKKYGNKWRVIHAHESAP